MRTNSSEKQIPTTFWTNCLWDTGASHSAITDETVNALALESIGETTAQYAQGEAITNVYKIGLNLPDLLFLPQLKVTECSSNEAFGVIIGMDVISLGDFSITNVNGVSTFSFCVPGMETIDYVKRIAGSKQDML